MSNGITTIASHPNFGVMPVEARNLKIDSKALGGGIQGSFGVLSFKGKNWAVRYHGETYPIWQYDTQGRPIGTVPALEVVLINVSPSIAKTYYEGTYVEGSTDAPDCWSPNGIVPDPSSPKLQSQTCGTCKWNRFGSKITDNGSQSKACQDHKRMAFVPAADMQNERYGGPMLLRAPPASLTGVLDYADKLRQMGWEWYALVTQISFDPTKAYPLIKFHEVRPLTPQEIAYVHQLQDDPRVARIINEGVEFDPLTPEQMAERGIVPAAAGAPPHPQHAAPPPLAQAQPAPPAPTAHTPPGAWGAPTPVTQPGNAPPPQAQGAPAAPPAGGWGGPPAQAQAPAAPPAAPPATGPMGVPPGMDAEQFRAFQEWQRQQAASGTGQQAPVQAQPPADAAPAAAQPAAKRPRNRRTPAVSPGPAAASTPAAPAQASAPPEGQVAAPPAAPAGAWGAPPAGAPAQANGAAAPAAPTNDPGMAQFDDRLNKLL
jgi:hypothetical protein